MSDDPWAAATFDGIRREHQRAFMALPFREKLEVIERMAEVAARLEAGSPVPREVPQADPPGTLGRPEAS